MEIPETPEKYCEFMESVSIKLMSKGIHDSSPDIQKLKLISNFETRVKLATKVLEENLDILPQISPCAKTMDASLKYRKDGNSFYTKKNDIKAMKSYNMALLHAPPESMELAYGYGNRSAIFFRIKQFQNCLKDISRALEFCTDEDLKKKLLKRRIDCEQIYHPIEDDEVEETIRRQFFSLPPRINPSVSCSSADIQSIRSPKYGQHILASSNIYPGDVLVVEKAHVVSLHKEYFQQKCYKCCKNNDAMIPCKSCNFVMFCDEECRQKSWDKIHKIECPIMHILANSGLSETFIFPLRAVIRARCKHNSWTDFMEAIRKEEQKSKNPNESVDCSGETQMYAFLFSHEMNESKTDEGFLFGRAIVSAIFLHYLVRETPFFSEFSKSSILIEQMDANPIHREECILFAGGVLLRYIMISDCNVFGISGSVKYNYAAALYPFSSTFNHSCFSNAKWINDGTTLVIKTIRPIKKGQQIFISYGQDYDTVDYETRQLMLQQYYRFKCDCEACENHWPLRADLPEKYSELMQLNLPMNCSFPPNFCKEVERGNKQFVLNMLDKLYRLAFLLEDFVPCRELDDVQNLIVICWDVFRDEKFN